MPLNLGGSAVSALYLGDAAIAAAYLGEDQVWPAGAGLLLDVAPNAAAAYSLRKLRTAYAGAALRVRESSGNTEADIGFSGVGLDTAALLTHTGANSGLAAKWYEQSGNNVDITNTTAGEQPRIVNAGSLETLGGLPVLVGDGSDDNLNGNLDPDVSGARLIVIVYSLSASTGGDYLFGLGASTRVSLRTGGVTTLYQDAASADASFADVFPHTHRVVTIYAEDDTPTIRVNGVTKTLSGPTSGLGVAQAISLFSRPGGNNESSAKIQEFAIWSGSVQSTVPAIEANIAAYYGISLP